MIRILFTLAGLTLCTACTAPTQAPGRIDPEAFSRVYTCADGSRFALRRQTETAVLTLDGRQHRLTRLPAASGVAYVGDGLRFAGKARQGRLQTPRGRLEGCTARPAKGPWHQAALLGIDFRALGQEPGWILDIDAERWLHLRAEYGRREVFMPVPEPRATDAGRVYRWTTADHRLEVIIREAPCRDAMSGAAFPYSVTVTLDGTRWRGCGRHLDGDRRGELR